MRKFVAIALASALLVPAMTSPAFAQSGDLSTLGEQVPSECSAVAPMPTLPSGATATPQEMTQAETAYQAWYTSTRASLECWVARVQELQAQTEQTTANYNAFISGFNTFNQGWEAEKRAFCDRPRMRCQDP